MAIIGFAASAQNVGIGTTTPNKARLVVSGTVGNTQAIFGEGQDGVSLETGSPLVGFNNYYFGGRYFMATGYAGSISMNSGTGNFGISTYGTGGAGSPTPVSTSLVTILQNGNVGLGNSLPTATLVVSRGSGAGGTAQFIGTTNSSHFNYSTNEETYIRGGKAASQVIINDVSSGAIRLAEGGGNVGIGLPSPAYKLDIAGNFRTAGIARFEAGIEVPYGSPAANKVLTAADNIGSANWVYPASYNTGFRVFESSARTIGSGTGSFLLFSNAVSGTGGFDDGVNFDNPTGSYVAPATGVYQFNATINFSPVVAGGGGYLELAANTASGSYIFARSTSAAINSGDITPRTLNLSFIARLSVGQKVYLTVFNSIVGTTITTQNGGGSTQTTFSGARLY